MNSPPNPYVKMEKAFGCSPTYNTRYTKRNFGGKTWCRCVCSLCIFFFLLILNLIIVFFYLFTVTNSQVPSYTIQTLELKSLNWYSNSSLETQFLATVKVFNPNAKIEFHYGDNSSVNVLYKGADVCSGKLPLFQQAPLNETVMTVDLIGTSEAGSGFHEAASKNNSHIPLVVKVKAPVRIVAEGYPLRDFKAFANCTLLLHTLAPNTTIHMMSSNTTSDYDFNPSMDE